MEEYGQIFLTTLCSFYREYIAWQESKGASIHIFATNRKIAYCNDNAYGLYGFTRVESLGQNGTKLLMEEQYHSLGDEATAQTANSQCVNGAFPVVHKSGQPFIVMAANTPFFTEDVFRSYRGVICASVNARDYNGPLGRNPQCSHRDFVSLLDQQQQASSSSGSSTGGISEIPRRELTIDLVIGRGIFETVYHARWRSMDVAIKVFHYEPKPKRYRVFKNEVSIMKDLRHSNVVQLIGVLLSPDDLCIITEFLPRGSLFQLLHKNKVSLNWRRRIQIALDIAQGMRFLHRCQPPIIHCDLKSQNLLVTNNWTVKIGDFGLACRLAEKHIKEKWAGTPQWMAPETLRYESNDEKSDVYSYGVVLWELVTGKIPWEGFQSFQVVLFKTRNECLEIPRDLDPQWASLIERCWHRDPELRPTFDEIIREFRSLQSGTGLAFD